MPRSLIRPILVILIAGYAASACSDDKPELTATASATFETLATPTPGPGASLSVSWAEASPPSPTPEEELARPWREQLGAAADDLWRLYVVEGAGEPRLFAETRRWLNAAPIWSADGRSLLQLYVSRISRPGLSGAFVHGYLQYAVADGRPAWQVQLEPGMFALASPTGDRVIASGETDPRTYLLTPGGGSRALEGLQAEALYLGWSPDGERFLLYTLRGPAFGQPARYTFYLLSPGASEAVIVSPGTEHGVAAWSPDSTRVAFLEGNELVIFNARARQRSVVPLGTTTYLRPRWSEDGRLIAVRDGVVDATANRVPVSPTALEIIDSAVSRDGKQLAVTTDPYANSRTCDAGIPPQNQTVLREIPGGNARMLLDCDRRFHAFIEWLPNGRLVLGGTNCWSCESTSMAVTLATLQGDELPLTDGLEAGASSAVSPDGRRLLVTGKKLRVYRDDGTLERVIEPPPGFSVLLASWSRDGRSFAYVVGPFLMVI